MQIGFGDSPARAVFVDRALGPPVERDCDSAEPGSLVGYSTYLIKCSFGLREEARGAFLRVLPYSFGLSGLLRNSGLVSGGWQWCGFYTYTGFQRIRLSVLLVSVKNISTEREFRRWTACVGLLHSFDCCFPRCGAPRRVVVEEPG